MPIRWRNGYVQQEIIVVSDESDLEEAEAEVGVYVDSSVHSELETTTNSHKSSKSCRSKSVHGPPRAFDVVPGVFVLLVGCFVLFFA